jgi:rhodanese-related sulfurtransferase
MKFILDNLMYISMFIISGGMLLWPILQRQRMGEIVNTQAAINLMNHENALLLDIRDTDAFARGHVAQAKNIPDTTLETRAAEYTKHNCIIIMDADGSTAGKTATNLRKTGIARVLVLEGGYAAWLAAKLPVKK